MADQTELRIIAAFDDAIRGMKQVRDEMKLTAGAAATSSAAGATAGQKFAQGWAQSADKIQAVGRSMSGAGRQLTTGLTLPIVAVGGAALKAAIDFESSFAGIRKTTDATEAQFAALDKSITEMSTRIPVSTTQLNAIGEMGGALGIPIEGMEKFIETVAILGATTDVSMEEGASAIAQLSNVMGTSTNDVDRYAATLVDLGNKGASTEGQILDMSKRIAGAGAVVGLSEAQVLGFAAGLANMGINAESGGSAISRAFIEAHSAITSGTKESQAALEVWADTSGMSVDQFKAAFEEDAAGAMTTFIGGLGKVIDEGGDVAGILDAVGLNSIQARDAFLRAAAGGTAFTDALDVATTAWGENTAAQAEADVRFGTTESQLLLLKNEFQNVARSLGDALIPFLKELIPILKDTVVPAIKAAVEWFTKLPTPVKRMIVAGAAFLAVLGPILLVLGGILSTVGTLLTPLAKFGGLFVKNADGISKVGKLVKFLGGAFTKLGGIIRFVVIGAFNLILAHPIIAAIAAIIATVVLLIKNWDTVGPFFERIWNWIVDIFWKAVEFLKNLFLNFTPLGLIINHWSTITAWFAGLWETVKGLFSSAITFLKNLFLNFTPLGLIIKHWSSITGFFSNLWSGVTGIIGTAIDTIKGILNGIKGAIDAVIGWFKGLWTSIKNVFGGIVETIKNAANKAKEWLNKLNPFAKFSPSLVEQVDKGVAKIGAAYSSLGDQVIEGPRVETTVKSVGTPDAANLPFDPADVRAIDVRLVAIDKSVLPIEVTGGGGAGGGTGGGLVDEATVAEGVKTGGANLGGAAGSVASGVRNLDQAISKLEDEAFIATLDPADRKFFEDARAGTVDARKITSDPKLRRISGGGVRVPPNLFSPELARAQAAAGVPITRLPIAKPPSEISDKVTQTQIVVNNPVAKETEDSVRSIATKNTYLGGNGVPKKKTMPAIKKSNTVTTQSSGGGGTLKPL